MPATPCDRCRSPRRHLTKQDCIDYLLAQRDTLEAAIRGEPLNVWDALAHPSAEEKFRIQQATAYRGDEEECA